jgi:magnesium chelatase subunit I
MRLVELPLNARIEDVVGGINERVALEQHRVLIEEGILAKAHHNLLYIDEINLLEPQVVDIILDAAAQGRTLVRRGAMIRLFASQFVLIGSMNPDEGVLRPQIMDRFGLRVWVAPLADPAQRITIYRRAQSFRSDPAAFRKFYAEQTAMLAEEVEVAREILPYVVIPPEVEQMAIAVIQELKIPSHRGEIALLEAARALAASDFRNQVQPEDIRSMACLTLRQRRSSGLESYAAHLEEENQTIQTIVDRITAP